MISAGTRKVIAYTLLGLFCGAVSLKVLASKPAHAAGRAGGCCVCDLALGNGVDSGFCVARQIRVLFRPLVFRV